MGESWAVDRSSTVVLGTRISLPWASATIRTSPSSRSKQTGDDLAVLEGEVRDPEALVDVAIGVEDVFEQPLEAAAADAVELGADLGPLALELVADPAVLLEDLGPSGQVVGRRRNPARRRSSSSLSF